MFSAKNPWREKKTERMSETIAGIVIAGNFGTGAIFLSGVNVGLPVTTSGAVPVALRQTAKTAGGR